MVDISLLKTEITPMTSPFVLRSDLVLTHLVQAPTVAPTLGERPPLLLLLHGVRSNERDLFGLASHLDGRFLTVSARGPVTFGPGQYGWYPVTFTPQGPIGDDATAETSRQTLLRFLDEAVRAYDADPARVFLAGFSQGAIMSLFTALSEPDKVAGVVAMSGRLIAPTLARRAPDDALRGLPIFAVHGLYDSVLPIADGRAIKENLEKLPVSLAYREYPMAHEVSEESLGDIANWLSHQLDNPATRPARETE